MQEFCQELEQPLEALAMAASVGHEVPLGMRSSFQSFLLHSVGNFAALGFTVYSWL